MQNGKRQPLPQLKCGADAHPPRCENEKPTPKGELFVLAQWEGFSRLRPKSRLRRLASDTPVCGRAPRSARCAARLLTLRDGQNKNPPVWVGFVLAQWEGFSRLRPKSRLRRLASDTPVCGRAPRSARFAARLLTLRDAKMKSSPQRVSFSFWRSGRDSNPRAAFGRHTISSRARYDHFDTTAYGSCARQRKSL